MEPSSSNSMERKGSRKRKDTPLSRLFYTPPTISELNGQDESSENLENIERGYLLSGGTSKPTEIEHKYILDSDDITQKSVEFVREDGIKNINKASDIESTSTDSPDESPTILNLRKNEKKTLVKKSSATSDKNDSPGNTSYEDTICSNRSAYFKQYYLGQKAAHEHKRTRKESEIISAQMGPLIKEKEEPLKEKKKKKPDYLLMVITLLLFIAICTSISYIFHSYHLYVANVFIFNRIKLVEVNRTLEVLSLAENFYDRHPLVKIRLGVGIPMKTQLSECTKYLHYLVDREGEVEKVRLKRSVEENTNTTRDDNDLSVRDTSGKFEKETDDLSKKPSYMLEDDMNIHHKYAEIGKSADKFSFDDDLNIYDGIKRISLDIEDDVCDSFSKGNTNFEHLFSNMECMYYKKTARLQLTHRPPLEDVDCFSVHWESLLDGHSLKDCFVMDNDETGSWWGIGDVTGGSIPLTNLKKTEASSLHSGEIQNDVIGGLLRRIWISSKGVLISIPSLSKSVFNVAPTGTNTGEFCLTSDNSNLDRINEKASLDYTVCTGPSVKALMKNLRSIECMNELEYSTSKWHRSAKSIPNSINVHEPIGKVNDSIVEEVKSRFNCPVWRPWISHSEGKIDQDDVTSYAESVALNMKVVCGYILLPVSWQVKLGDLEFDPVRFPNPQLMKETLFRKGLRLALTLSALVDTNTEQFKYSTTNNLLITQVNSTLPILVRTGDGNTAGVADFTNPNTMEWYESKLRVLVEKYSIDKFHLSPITTSSLPPYREMHDFYQNPDYAMINFAKTVSRISTPISTDATIIPISPPTFLTCRDGDGSWDMLKMLPNRVLSISSVGGNLVDSGVIGGWSDQPGHIADMDLYIRWMQVSIFLPAFQVSTLPSMYDKRVEQYAQTFMEIRRKLVIPRFIQDIKENIENGFSFISSLAMMFPDDKVSLSVGDQWMVGTDLLVAPILNRLGTARNIYLPPGYWKDPTYDRLLKGERWIRNYPVPLHKVPYFFKIVPETGNYIN